MSHNDFQDYYIPSIEFSNIKLKGINLPIACLGDVSSHFNPPNDRLPDHHQKPQNVLLISRNQGNSKCMLQPYFYFSQLLSQKSGH